MNSNELTGSDIDKLADLIAQRLNKQPPANNVVWNTEDCANYFRVTRKQFTDRVSKRPDFPAPIKGVSCKWIKADVIKWAER